MPIKGSSAPTLQGSPLATLDVRGPCTPVQPLILECELCEHPDKAFVEQLLSDIRQGCNIGYTGPQFAFTARILRSTYEALAKECSLNRILWPFDPPIA